MRTPSFLASLVLAVTLTGCGGTQPVRVEVGAKELTSTGLQDLSCDRARQINTWLAERLDAPEGSGKFREVVSAGLNPTDKQAVAKVQSALTAACEGPSSTPTPAASDDPVASQPDTTPSTSPSSSPDTSSDEINPADWLPYRSWTGVVADPPIDLEGRINDAADQSGFDYPQVEKWGAMRLRNDAGQKARINARVLLVFGEKSPSANDINVARVEAGVADVVPIITVSDCEVINGDGLGCPTQGLRLILAPLNDEGKLVKGWGVVLIDGAPLISYDGKVVWNP